MLDRGKRNILGVGIDVVDYDAAVARIMASAHARRPFAVSALAVHGVMTGALDDVQRFRLNALDLVVPDGQPVRWALRWLHREHLPSRVYGPELMQRICARAAAEEVPIFLYGSRPDVLRALERRLRIRHRGLRIAGRAASRFKRADERENAEVLAEIKAAGPAIVFAGLGCPRQEVFAYENAPVLSMPIIAVGAAFDFHAGLLPQAPRFMQEHGLEWLFRLVMEPRRLWRRYLVLNPLFLWGVVRQLVRPQRFEGRGLPPAERENFV